MKPFEENPGERILWLASYPKSGNTWFRVFLANLQLDGEQPVDINILNNQIGMASSRQLFDEASAVEASQLSHKEIDAMRPDTYRFTAGESKTRLYLKVHDAYTYLPDGAPMFPLEVTEGTIYFIRNPLDVAVSFAHHSNVSIDEIIQRMNDPRHTLCGKNDGLDVQLRQRLLCWSRHVRSWTEVENMPLHLVRYEDMKQKPMETFAGILSFLGLNYSETRIEKALAFSSIEELQRQEQEKGFQEKHPASPSFFRKGEVGTWKEVLTPEQVESIVTAHREIMKEYGYLEFQQTR